MSGVATTCPYCGTGCGLRVDTSGSQLLVRADPDHPANLGRLCSKGSALAESLGLEERLLYPQISGHRVSWNQALDTVAGAITRSIHRHGPDSIAFYVSGQLLTEDYYAANKLMKGFVGSANIDTNSRLCMASSVAAHKRAFGSDTVPCNYEDLELARTIVLVGSNTAWCHPVLYQRIIAARDKDPGRKLVVIDPRRTITCEQADLHLPIRPGTDVTLFNGLLCWLYEQGFANEVFLRHCTRGLDQALSEAQGAGDIKSVATTCGLDAEQVEAFYQLFADTERVVTAWSQGVNQSSSGTDKVNAIINCHLLTGRIGRPGSGPFSLTGQPNAMGGREAGGLANQLAAHMDLDNKEHRQIVQQFWDSPGLAAKPGHKAVDLFRAAEDGQIKVLWIMATNPVDSLPDADQVRRALRRCELVVVSDCMQKTDTTACADVLLPALTWGEKDGTVTNSERCISRQRQFLAAPGEARADWWIVSEVARRMGFASAFAWQTPAEIFREHAALSGVENNGRRDFDISMLAGISDQQYDQLQPVRWPLHADAERNRRVFADGRFFTQDGRARFVAVSGQSPARATDEEFPLILNTGRLRDQWHTMTRTGRVPRLVSHSPEPLVEVHPDDAGVRGLQNGALARLRSHHGSVVLRVRVSEHQRRGSLFVPIHWNDQHASQARINALVNPDTDPISGQPELKHTPVTIEALPARWYGFVLSRRQLPIHDLDYWVQARGKGYYRYELAGNQPPEAWPRWARELLCQQDSQVEWLEYLDQKLGGYRGIRLAGGRLESCIFIDPDRDLPDRDWLSGLFDLPRLSDTERRCLLAGAPASAAQETGRVVCACFNVGETALRRAIVEQGICSIEGLSATLKAGGNCGSCVPEIKAMIEQNTRKHIKNSA